MLTNVEVDLPLVADSDLVVGGLDSALIVPETDTVDFRSDLQARALEVKAAGKMVGVARGAMLPHVNLSVHWDRFSQQDLFGDDARSYTLGIYGTWDLVGEGRHWGPLVHDLGDDSLGGELEEHVP